MIFFLFLDETNNICTKYFLNAVPSDFEFIKKNINRNILNVFLLSYSMYFDMAHFLC